MSSIDALAFGKTCPSPVADRNSYNWAFRLSKSLEALLDPVIGYAFIISTIVAGIMAVPIAIDVLARFAFDKSVTGIIEIEEFAMVIIVFLALAAAQKKDGHIVIDLFTCRLSKRNAALLETFNLTTCLFFFSLITYRTVLITIRKIPEFSTMLQIPNGIFYGITALGFLLLSLVLLQQLLQSLSANIQDRAWLGLAISLTIALLVAFSPWYIKSLPWHPGRLAFGGMGMGFMMILLLLGMPIGFAMGLVGFIGLSYQGVNLLPALNTLGMAPYSTTASFILAVAPLFIFMGLLASEAGISQELFDTGNKWLGRMPGGLAMASIAGCAGFSAVCGDSMATALTMGSVALPEMNKKKYDPGFSCGTLAAGGTLGILIPPSVGFIFYAIVTEESVGKLFIAGIVPGILLSLMYMVCIWIIASRRPEIAPRGEATTWKEKLISVKGIFGMLFLFVLILGGILAGIFSPTEGGGIGVVGAFLITLVRRRLTWKGLVAAAKDTVLITTRLLMILIGVGILSYFLAASRLPFDLADLITTSGLSRYVILFSIIVLYIILGCLMNVIPMILLTLPAIFPTVKAMGFDPIWFGVLTVIIMEMGQVTPPIGVNVFALSSVAKGVPMSRIFVGIIPFFICMLIMLSLLIVFPGLALWLVGVFF